MHRVRHNRPGRLVPAGARALRSRSIGLAPGRAMAWHTTGEREELILVMQGLVVLEVAGRARAPGAGRRARLRAGAGMFLGPQTWHRVLNGSRGPARYVYVTAAPPAAGVR